jgi:P-type conjugative transfer protein TrbG
MSGGNNSVYRALGATLLTALPSLAHAQDVQVPAIQTAASAAATASASTPTDQAASSGDGSSQARVATKTVQGTMPPPIPLMSPNSVSLNANETRAVALSRRWAGRGEMPQAGDDGYVRFLFGATLPTVVCAPLQVCDLALQPGEIVNNVNLGDSVRWKITPSLSGFGETQTTHLIINPTDAGLISSLDIETNRRTYAVKLVSTQSSWMPLIAFNYPDDAQTQWQNYRRNVGLSAAVGSPPGGQNTANLEFLCISPASGGPGWAPTRAYTDGIKTYVEFPVSLNFIAAPALVALANDGTWFSSASPQIVNYRVMGNRYVVDAVLERAALISGVGDGQQRVLISRGSQCR